MHKEIAPKLASSLRLFEISKNCKNLVSSLKSNKSEIENLKSIEKTGRKISGKRLSSY